MLTVFDVQGVLLTVATLAIFVIQGWAFSDAVSHRSEAFVATDRMTKKAWLIILGLALVAHMIFWHPISLLNIAGTIAAIVYMVDVRPALRSVTNR